MLKSGVIDSTPAKALTVVVADDDRLTALTLADSLTRHGLKNLATVHTAGDAIAAVTQLKPDVLVVDLDFGPGPTGIDVALAVRRNQPTIGVVIITAYEDPRLLAPGLPQAPAGSLYLVKQQITNPEQVAIAAKMSRDAAINPTKKKIFKTGVGLTNQQIELLRLVAAGLSNQAIAEALSLTPESVKKSITRLAKRVGAPDSS